MNLVLLERNMRAAVLLGLLVLTLFSFCSSPLLKTFYRAVYRVEFGPKYTQMAGGLNRTNQ